MSADDVTKGQTESHRGASKFFKGVTGYCGEQEGVAGRPAQPGTHPVSLGSGDTSGSPLTGHALQTWRALSPRGASWASCALLGRGLCDGQLLLWAPQAPFPPLLPLPRPLWVSPSIPPAFHLHPPSPVPFHPEDHTHLTYFGTISARSAGETAGPLEALGTGGATFSWETSFTLEWRHHGTVRQRPEEDREPGRSREIGAELAWGARWWGRTWGCGSAGTGRQNRSEKPLGNGQQDTHPGTHEAGSSSFTRNTLKIKEECKRARFFCPGAELRLWRAGLRDPDTLCLTELLVPPPALASWASE